MKGRMNMIRVLFVCLGNICRSPMAEAVFRDLVDKENLTGKIEADSGGIGDWHSGEPPHKGTRKLLDKYQIGYKELKARQVNVSDWRNFNYIIAMDEQNRKDMQSLSNKAGSAKLAKLMDFVENPREGNIPDPYYTDNFDYTYELISEGCNELLKYIREENNI